MGLTVEGLAVYKSWVGGLEFGALLGFRVVASGFGVLGLGCRLHSLDLQLKGVQNGAWISSFQARHSGVELGVQDLRPLE